MRIHQALAGYAQSGHVKQSEIASPKRTADCRAEGGGEREGVEAGGRQRRG